MWDYEQLRIQKEMLAELRAIRSLLEEASRPKPYVFNITGGGNVQPCSDDRRVGSVGIDPR